MDTEQQKFIKAIDEGNMELAISMIATNPMLIGFIREELILSEKTVIYAFNSLTPSRKLYIVTHLFLGNVCNLISRLPKITRIQDIHLFMELMLNAEGEDLDRLMLILSNKHNTDRLTPLLIILANRGHSELMSRVAELIRRAKRRLSRLGFTVNHTSEYKYSQTLIIKEKVVAIKLLNSNWMLISENGVVNVESVIVDNL